MLELGPGSILGAVARFLDGPIPYSGMPLSALVLSLELTQLNLQDFVDSSWKPLSLSSEEWMRAGRRDNRRDLYLEYKMKLKKLN